jgi:hypothetical protein
MRLYAKMPLAPSRTHQQVQDGYGDHNSDLAEMTVNKASCFVCGKGASCGLKAMLSAKSSTVPGPVRSSTGNTKDIAKCGTKNVLKHTYNVWGV